MLPLQFLCLWIFTPCIPGGFFCGFTFVSIETGILHTARIAPSGHVSIPVSQHFFKSFCRTLLCWNRHRQTVLGQQICGIPHTVAFLVTHTAHQNLKAPEEPTVTLFEWMLSLVSLDAASVIVIAAVTVFGNLSCSHLTLLLLSKKTAGEMLIGTNPRTLSCFWTW